MLTTLYYRTWQQTRRSTGCCLCCCCCGGVCCCLLPIDSRGDYVQGAGGSPPCLKGGKHLPADCCTSDGMQTLTAVRSRERTCCGLSILFTGTLRVPLQLELSPPI
jgi:hypothetical protein